MKHLLSTADLSYDDALAILDTAEEMSAVSTRDIKKLPTLRGRTVVNLFYEDSTRTRVSFETAAKRLSADVINVAAQGSSVSKGESLKDTVLTLEAMGAEAIVLRHSASGAPAQLAAAPWSNSAILNAGDGTHEHPTQALLDAMTLRRALSFALGTSPRGQGLSGGTRPARILIIGDILHSRVARSNVWLLTTLGAEVSLVAPATLLPSGIGSWPVTVYSHFDDALDADPDAVMMLRIQAERMSGGYFPTAAEYALRWGLHDERLETIHRLRIGDTDTPIPILHPGPMNRGVEISARAADSSQARITEQVSNGIAVRMAALHLLLSHHSSAEGHHTTVPGQGEPVDA